MAEALGGRMTRGSGNQFANQMDGRHDHFEEFMAFAWDGKSTLGKSISVTREMWDKAVEQSHGERPMLGLCFYDDERLQGYTDLVIMEMDDLKELREKLNELLEKASGC